nr:hypothetical protein [Accumulibacter sp.]
MCPLRPARKPRRSSCKKARRKRPLPGGEIDVALRHVAGPVGDARRIGTLNVAASCITCVAAAIALWVAVH